MHGHAHAAHGPVFGPAFGRWAAMAGRRPGPVAAEARTGTVTAGPAASASAAPGRAGADGGGGCAAATSAPPCSSCSTSSP
jgi:hypothetical protein